MATQRRSDDKDSKPTPPPSRTVEGIENDLVSDAIRLAQKQLREGTASAQVITHYLKLGSSREALEQERMAIDSKLAQAKIDQLASQQRVEELIGNALAAMKSYTGNGGDEEDDDYDD